jgi:hypothetical protein
MADDLDDFYKEIAAAEAAAGSGDEVTADAAASAVAAGSGNEATAGAAASSEPALTMASIPTARDPTARISLADIEPASEAFAEAAPAVSVSAKPKVVARSAAIPRALLAKTVAAAKPAMITRPPQPAAAPAAASGTGVGIAYGGAYSLAPSSTPSAASQQHVRVGSSGGSATVTYGGPGQASQPTPGHMPQSGAMASGVSAVPGPHFAAGPGGGAGPGYAGAGGAGPQATVIGAKRTFVRMQAGDTWRDDTLGDWPASE